MVAQADLRNQRLAELTAMCDKLRLQLHSLQSAHVTLQSSHAGLADRLEAALDAKQAANDSAASAESRLTEAEARQAVSCIVARAVQRALAEEARDLRKRVTAS